MEEEKAPNSRPKKLQKAHLRPIVSPAYPPISNDVKSFFKLTFGSWEVFESEVLDNGKKKKKKGS